MVDSCTAPQAVERGSAATAATRERAASPASPNGITSGDAPLRIGTVALTVRDLGSVGGFYEEVIGLRAIERTPSLLRLGVDGVVLLELRHEPEATLAGRHEAGLFHTAFLLPSRGDLARWLRHARSQGVRLQGASDHLVSEAFYLADPEGNGIEVYRDRPSVAWARSGGMIEMATRPLDVPSLLAEADGTWEGLPRGSLIGHVHLQVGDLGRAERFYADLLGLPVTSRYPGGTFYGSGGYHHHLATNVWNSAGASRRRAGTTGLASVELVAGQAVAADIAARAGTSPKGADEGGFSLSDPWGTTFVVRRR